MSNAIRSCGSVAAVLMGMVLASGVGCSSLQHRRLPGRESFGQTQQHYVFFSDGQSRCRIRLPEAPEPEEREAGELIQRLFREMGGVQTPLVTGNAGPFDGVDIHVGKTEFAEGLRLLPHDLDADGFVIHPHDAHRLVLLGGRSVSTFYAATEFFERYAGLLWVWPGEHGTVVPQTNRFEASIREQFSEPAFHARKFSGMHGTKMAYYRIHSTARETRSNFHHNVWRVLTAEMYEQHPDYFSLVNGERRKPTKNKSNWQACTSNPKVVETFVEAAKQQFEKQPWISAFSVSQNDGHGFCECDSCRALDIAGVEGISDRYFTFVNAVADGIRDQYPDKFIGCLAYGVRGTAAVPVQVKLRPNTLIYAVVPTLEDHHQTIRQWSKAAPNLGVYFWIHGKAVPKFYPQRWARYLNFLRRHNVREVYAEVYQENPDRMATWQLDGPRVWITAKLLWNPDADIDELMHRFCNRFYGPAAAPMLRYYKQCEKAWERSADPYDFGKKWREPEFDRYTAADMVVMERCVQEALELANGILGPTARLQALDNALAPVAGYIRQLALADELDDLPIRHRRDAEAAVARVHEVETRARQLLHTDRSLFGTLPNDTETAIDTCFGRITEHLGSGAEAFWQDIEKSRPELKRFTAPQLLAISGKVVNVATNPSFEFQRATEGAVDEQLEWRELDAPGWNHWVRPGTPGTVGVASNVARTGTRSLVVHGVEAACGIYNQTAKPGERYRLTCWAKTTVAHEPGKERKGGHMQVKWRCPEGKWLSGLPTHSVELPADATDWQCLRAVVTIPQGVGKMVLLLGSDKQRPDEKTWFDDLCIERLYEAPTP